MLAIAAWLIAPIAHADASNTHLIKMLELRQSFLNETDVTSLLKDPWEGVTIRPALALPPAGAYQRPSANHTLQTGKWKRDIMTTVFWIGEDPTKNNPTPNNKSSWDTRWEENFGGFDCPKNRIGYRPAGFVPRQNPFYIALPYNDINTKGTKPEASKVIPWFHREFIRSGKSVVKGKWLAIHHNGKIAYAQWEDTGPYRTDHWEYVFGNERPSPNRNQSAGLDVSPAVRDYLGMKGNVPTDWKFVETWEVPMGPWSKYGENNPFSPQFVPDPEKAAKSNPQLVQTQPQQIPSMRATR